MPEETDAAFGRAVGAINAGEIDALLEELDPAVEWHDVFGLMLGGEEAVYRGHDGIRTLFDDLFNSFAEIHSQYSALRDRGGMTIATGRLRALGKESGAVIESPIWTITRWKRGRATYVRTYLDRDEAMEAAGPGD